MSGLIGRWPSPRVGHAKRLGRDWDVVSGGTQTSVAQNDGAGRAGRVLTRRSCSRG